MSNTNNNAPKKEILNLFFDNFNSSDENKPLEEKESPGTDSTQMSNREKIEAAKFFGNKEMREFRDIIEDTVAKIENLALFRELGVVIRSIAIDQCLDILTEPIFKGNKPPWMREEDYLAVRQEMYKSIIKKYKIGIEEK